MRGVIASDLPRRRLLLAQQSIPGLSPRVVLGLVVNIIHVDFIAGQEGTM